MDTKNTARGLTIGSELGKSQGAAAPATKRMGAGKFALLFWGLPFVLLVLLLATRSSCA